MAGMRWVHTFKYDAQYNRQRVATGRIVRSHGDGSCDIETADGARVIASWPTRHTEPVTPDEAKALTAQRKARIAREDERKANRGIDVSGRSFFARRARR
jgi:hypothetical protein